jgi:hypothetical protein
VVVETVTVMVVGVGVPAVTLIEARECASV